jgi:hypothetical protein
LEHPEIARAVTSAADARAKPRNKDPALPEGLKVLPRPPVARGRIPAVPKALEAPEVPKAPEDPEEEPVMSLSARGIDLS